MPLRDAQMTFFKLIKGRKKAPPADDTEEPICQVPEPVEETTNIQKTGTIELSTEIPKSDEPEKPGETVGFVYGNVGTSSFNCRIVAKVERSEYVEADNDDYGTILCQINDIVRKTNLTAEMSTEASAKIEETISAQISVIGYRDNRGILQVPRTTFKAGTAMRRASGKLIQNVLGLTMSPKISGYIGLLHGHDIPVRLNINELLQRHVCILAKTGGGKSYMSGDIIEELIKKNVTCMIIDPHGEYGAIRESGKGGELRFGVVPTGYADSVLEFAVSETGPHIRPLKFTFKSLEAREIIELTRNNDVRTFLPALKRAIESIGDAEYSVRDLIDAVTSEHDGHNAALITELEYVDDIGIFAPRGNRIDELVVKGKTTVVNLKGVPPDIQELIVRRLGTMLFELRKADRVPPMMLVVEEAHNYCPQVGAALSSKILSTIASEGRKFGLGLMVISQRPAKIDKNVLSQCGTQIILKVTNPNDLKAIAASVEGLTSGMTDDVQTMPIGMAMVVGAGIESPLLVDVRPRESRHGGSGVTVLSEDDE